jgi:hypothetical protein
MSCLAAILPPIGSDQENLGPELLDSNGKVWVDVYAPGCLNEWSWKYNPAQDPFGSILSEV